jgi:hypothetical protein
MQPSAATIICSSVAPGSPDLLCGAQQFDDDRDREAFDQPSSSCSAASEQILLTDHDRDDDHCNTPDQRSRPYQRAVLPL